VYTSFSFSKPKMSSLSTFSTEQLLVIQSLVSNALSGTPSAAGKTQLGKNGKPVKLTKSGKVSKRTGKPTVHADFTKHILAAHKDDVAAFKAEHPDQKGAHLSFAANYRKEHAEEFEAFKTKWSEEHPKTDSDADVSDASSDASGEAPAAVIADGVKVKKPRAPLTQEHKDAMQAGRQKKKAEKEAAAAAAEAAAKGDIAAPVALVVAAPAVAAPAAAPAAAPVKKQVKQAKKAEVVAPVALPLPESPKEVEEEPEMENIPFTHTVNGVAKKYIRLGERRTDGNHIWASADLWENKKGQRGSYVGVLQDDGKIDNTATEPDVE
jgi:hypothetical protein